jgi:hypothetical protein
MCSLKIDSIDECIDAQDSIDSIQSKAVSKVFKTILSDSLDSRTNDFKNSLHQSTRESQRSKEVSRRTVIPKLNISCDFKLLKKRTAR